MSRQSRGLRFEHEVAKEIFEVSGGTIIPVRAGYSGNSGVPLPDLLVPVSGSLRAIEIKTSSQDRFSITPDDVEQVVNWSMDMTEIPTYPYLSIKFTNYEVWTGRIVYPWDIERSFEEIASAIPFVANVTDSGNLSVHNPTKLSYSERSDRSITSAQKSPGDGAAMIKQLREDEYANVSSDAIEAVGIYEVLNENEGYADHFRN